ncbi:Acyl_transf_3 domain-containing protein [Caenorhabditis elegans]|uniref:Acyl_transf_3 domain-containing protein n=1 Tax=Caenorhabditis elegans TaxID=6239 RepID=O16467_CAEEL|nr:Acyl_transf_3 domain-containing protein [Caenorhabditis elegans]CCD64092.2 Acyl_transf_3 domain-containing protein [Caenorhabditis elegans]|eukprot:NP_505228.2 O-ACyltransferase homolog [Caenorhabditis elegans]
MSSSKFQSLQGLRGISIILVLIFHLFPKIFSNGFVGVDMFFVLSGYLMTKILSKEFTLKSVLIFYKNRFIRIIPLYYLTIFGTIIGVLCLVLRTERSDFLFDVRWCLPLISNFQPIFEHHSYWDQVSTIRYLTHLWSLCTELQYYLMAPIIYFIASNLSNSNRIFGYSLAIIILFLFQLLTPFELSYCFLASRVWQFLLGSVAFDLSQKNNETMDFYIEMKKNKENWNLFDIVPYIFLAVLTTVLILPWMFGEHLTRFAMSICAAILCLLCGRLENSFLTFPPLAFIGDISYVTYLIHWPVINFVKYIQQKDHLNLEVYEAVIAIFVVFVLSLLSHFLIEKKLSQFDFYINFTITAFTIGMCLAMIPWIENNQCLAMKTLSNPLIENAEFNFNKSNTIIPISDLGCDFNETTAKLPLNTFGIEYCSKKGNGTGTIMVIGNSLSIRAFSTIFKLFDGRYEEIRLFAKHGGAPLLNIVPLYNAVVLDMARDIKPDLLWIIQGMNEITFHGTSNTYNFESNALDEVIPKTLDTFKTVAKMVFIDLPYYVTIDYPAKLMARSLIYRKNLEEKLAVNFKTVNRQLSDQTDRLLNANCSNCQFNDIQKALTNGSDKFYLFEKDTYKALTYDGSHLTLTGFKYIEPIYQKGIDSYFQMLDSSENL